MRKGSQATLVSDENPAVNQTDPYAVNNAVVVRRLCECNKARRDKRGKDE